MFACMVLASAATSLACSYEHTCRDYATCPLPPDAATDAPVTSQPEAGVEAGPPPIPATNPYGRAYPAANLGWAPRSSTPGSVIPNVGFADASSPDPKAPTTITPMRTMELAELFDPEGRTHDVVIVALVTEWDAASGPFLDALGKQPDRVVVLSVLGQGAYPAEVPEKDNFYRWQKRYPWSWHAIDPLFAKLEDVRPEPPQYPIVLLLDARTMEIAYRKNGHVQPTEIDTEIASIRPRGPAY
jgi:hypothetical protein